MFMKMGMGLNSVKSIFNRFWSPANITTSLWLDAADSSTITESEGKVSVWADKSGNDRDISQDSGSSQPSYSNNALTFDGIDDYLFNTSPFMYANGEIDIYIVASFTSNQSSKRIIGETYAPASNPEYSFTLDNQPAGGNKMSAFIKTNTGVLSAQFPILNNNILVDNTYKIINFRDFGDTLNGYLNTLEGNDHAYTRAAIILDVFSVGCRIKSANTEFINGSIKEIVVSNILSTEERQKIEGYLAHKWGLTDNLPAGHPYKTTRPTV